MFCRGDKLLREDCAVDSLLKCRNKKKTIQKDMVVKLLCFVLDKFKENSFVIKFFFNLPTHFAYYCTTLYIINFTGAGSLSNFVAKPGLKVGH